MQVRPNSATPHVTGAIRQAAHSTGTSFNYLLATAQIESNLNPAAQASTSSAQGLFQFIDQTWLATMKRSGSSLGLGRYANAIAQAPDGRLEVPDAAERDAIMKLRADPRVSAMMGGAYTRANAAQLTEGLGRAPSEGELYIAHFLGSEGATKLIGAAFSQPKTRAADIFPQAAAANRPIFYDRAGSPRGALEVYRVLTGRYEVARAGTASAADPEITGHLRGSLPANTAAPRMPSASPLQVAHAPDTAGLTSAYADANADAPPMPDTKPLFQAMFTTRERQGVAPVVSELWAPAKASADQAVRTLELFTDTKPDARKLFGGV